MENYPQHKIRFAHVLFFMIWRERGGRVLEGFDVGIERTLEGLVVRGSVEGLHWIYACTTSEKVQRLIHYRHHQANNKELCIAEDDQGSLAGIEEVTLVDVSSTKYHVDKNWKKVKENFTICRIKNVDEFDNWWQLIFVCQLSFFCTLERCYASGHKDRVIFFPIEVS